MSPDAYHHEDALNEPFSIRAGDHFQDTCALYRVRVVEGGFALVENLNELSPYFDHPRQWMSLGTLAAMRLVIM